MCTPATISLRYGPSPFASSASLFHLLPLYSTHEAVRSLVFTLLHLELAFPLSSVRPDTFPLCRVVLVRWLRRSRGMGREKWPDEEDTDEDNCLIVNPRSRSTRFANLRVTLRPTGRTIASIYSCSAPISSSN